MTRGTYVSSSMQIPQDEQPRMSADEITFAQDGTVLLDIEHDRLLKLNRMGVEIWDLLNRGKSELAIVEKIAQQYNADRERVAQDVRALLKRISELGITPAVLASPAPIPAAPRSEFQSSYPWYGQHTGNFRPKPKITTVLSALIGLAAFDFVLSFFSMKGLCACVQRWRMKPGSSVTAEISGRICAAVERACVWYPKQALCLQRSAVTACLLRNHGIPAQMTIGVRPMPFLAHAWVEVEGSVINDWPGVKKFYPSLARY